MRIVIDTNIWVSGLLWKGDAWSLLALAEKGHLSLCVAYPMLLELEEVLGYKKFKPRLKLLQQTPASLTACALSLSMAFDVSRSGPPIVSADPDDDIFLLCAAAAKADFVVTEDRHLLALKSYLNIPVVNTRDFMKQFPKEWMR